MLKLRPVEILQYMKSESHVASALRGCVLWGALALGAIGVLGLLTSGVLSGFVKLLPVGLLLMIIVLFVQLADDLPKKRLLLRAASIIAIGGYVVFGLLSSYVNALIFDGPQYDGAFQLYFPLLRMDAGEWPGTDFFYFHGQLIPVLVYPFYKLFGGDFFAAQFSAKLIDLFLPVFYFVIFRLLGLNRFRAILGTVLLVGFLVTDRFAFATQNPVDGVHSYALRSLLPFLYIAFLSWILASDRRAEIYRRTFLTRAMPVQSFVFVLSFYLGSEQAFYFMAALLLANLVIFRFTLIKAAGAIVLTLVAALLLLFAANYILFGSQQPLSYLSEISRNQTWFYGSYPNEFFTGIIDFTRYQGIAFRSSVKVLVCLAGIPLLLYVSWVSRDRLGLNLFYFTLIAGAYGLLGLTSFIASYAGEQYADNAVKAILIIFVVVLICYGIERKPPRLAGKKKVILDDMISASPVALAVVASACAIAIVSSMNIMGNLTALRFAKTPFFMDVPELGVHIPYYPQEFREDNRYHFSQFLALAQANGDESARVIYPETTYVDGFDAGLKTLYKLQVDGTIPTGLGVGDYCVLGSEALRVADIGRDAATIALGFDSERAGSRQWQRALGLASQTYSTDCYRRSAQDAMQYHGTAIWFEQHRYDNHFIDGAFRTDTFQVRLRSDSKNKLRVGDVLEIGTHDYRVEEVHSSRVVVLSGEDFPLPFDFNHGAAYRAILKVGPDNNFAERVRFIGEGDVVTRMALYDRTLLAQLAEQEMIVTTATNRQARIESVDMAGRSMDIAGVLDTKDLIFGFHLGALDRAAFQVAPELPPVYQVMKGVLSAANFDLSTAGSNVDFMFHTFTTELLDRYLDALRDLAPEFISVPSGRYIHNMPWYDNWLLRARWPVFKYIVENYDYASSSLFESFWRSSETVADHEPWTDLGVVEADSSRIVIPVDQRADDICPVTAYEIEVSYDISGWQLSLPLFGASTRHIALIDDLVAVPLTFNPNENIVTFPVFSEGKDVSFAITSIAPFGIDTQMTVSGIRYREIRAPAGRLGALVGRCGG